MNWSMPSRNVGRQRDLSRAKILGSSSRWRSSVKSHREVFLEPLNPSQDVLLIQHHGEFLIVSVSPVVEGLDFTLGDILADAILNSLRSSEQPLVVIDLAGVEIFGSMFLTVMLRCWKTCVTRGGMMVLCGVGSRVRELLKIVRLDVLWPIYQDREEAMKALSAD